ncbi:MAG: efflux RND transporter periplasmic adaptor subunit [Rectinemataceae bacterium]
MKRIAILPLSAAILAAALAFSGCNAPKPAGPATIKTEVAKKGRIVMDQEISGVLVPNKSLNIYAKLAGQAKSVGVEIGDRVTEGQLLVEIDTKELNAQLEVAEASGATVRDQAAQAKIGIESARLNLDLAQKSYDRNKALFDSKAVTQSALDDAETKLELAKTSYDNAEHQFQTVGGSGIAQADAQVNLIKVQISNSVITSPISGTVTNRNINVGEMTSPNAPLMTIADTSNLKFQGNASQDAVVLMKVGDVVHVMVDGMGGPGYTGKVSQVGPIAAATGQYFPIAISIVNDRKLLAGMTGKAVFTLTSPEGVVIPFSALATEGGQTSVFVVSEGKVVRRPVSLGLRGASDILVLSGLAPGESVATSNLGMLQNGTEVRP